MLVMKRANMNELNEIPQRCRSFDEIELNRDDTLWHEWRVEKM